MLHFLSQPVATIGVAGNATSLHCNVSGFPITTVLWYKNGNLILSDFEEPPILPPDRHESNREMSHGIYITQNVAFGFWNSVLTIIQLSVTDTGDYHCEAIQQELTIASNITWLLVQR